MERDYKTYEDIAKWMNTFCGDEFFEIDKNGFYFEDYASEWKWKDIFDLMIKWNKIQQNTKTELPNNCNIPVVSNAVCCENCKYEGVDNDKCRYCNDDYNLFESTTDC